MLWRSFRAPSTIWKPPMTPSSAPLYAAHQSAGQHDLAGRSWLKNLLVRAYRIGEQQFLADNRPQGTVFEAREQPGVDLRLFGRGNGPEGKRANRSAAPHQLTGIDGDLATTADHDDSTIVGQKFRVMGEVHVREHFQNDVHAAVVCRLPNFFLMSGLAVIENLMDPVDYRDAAPFTDRARDYNLITRA